MNSDKMLDEHLFLLEQMKSSIGDTNRFVELNRKAKQIIKEIDKEHETT